MSLSCVKHPMTLGAHICGECGHQFCPECVVFPFGTAKPPLCVACALEIGGVRRQKVDRPKLTRKSIKERLAMQRAGTVTPPLPPTEPQPATASSEGERERDDEGQGEDRWLDGSVDAEDVPGGWHSSYP